MKRLGIGHLVVEFYDSPIELEESKPPETDAAFQTECSDNIRLRNELEVCRDACKALQSQVENQASLIDTLNRKCSFLQEETFALNKQLEKHV